ncbi:MAG: hypothetical protein MJZ30_06235 [Paludibacteraceae bacterium]|nr:hypothetical protein [Paludibacteraceae bacterium]
MEKPTQQQIADAEAYLRYRIDTTDEVESACYDLFREAAKKVAEIVIKYHNAGRRLRFRGSSAMAREIDEVISWLESEIEFLVDSDITPDDDGDNKHEVMDIAKGMDHGATYEERSRLYHLMFGKQLDDADWTAFFADYDSDIDDDELIGFITDSSEKAAHRWILLALNTIAVGWSIKQLIEAKRDGKRGFFVINGSSPCEFCVGMQGFHSIEDTPPPYHPHCQCIAIYV